MIATIALACAAAAQPAVPNRELGSHACAECHAAIYKSYQASGMSRSAGRMGTGQFYEKKFGADIGVEGTEALYQIRLSADGSYLLEHRRAPGESPIRRSLAWFVGSGNVGRSYLFSHEGYLFHAPVSYYSSTGEWNLSPGFQHRRGADFGRLVETRCLQCHASQLQMANASEHRFAEIPFLEGGVSCERCHGPGSRHVARMKTGGKGALEIVNPKRLEAERRDSVCAQCHLTGASRIARAPAKRSDYQAGGRLSDYVAVFVWADPVAARVNATSHFEKLAHSACKMASADKLWCGSCHDPHSIPDPSARVEYYRRKCQACHEKRPCTSSAESRRASGDNCAFCHMPKAEDRSVEHRAYTDHSIPRKAASRTPAGPASGGSLVPFWKTAADGRDLAMAMAALAQSEAALRRPAFELLVKESARNPEDMALLGQLAQFHDRMGNEAAAMEACERIVRADPSNTAAKVNLGIYYVKRGRSAEAIGLWQDALKRNPSLTGARMNLGVALFHEGRAAEAEAALAAVLQYEPDNDAARRLLAEVRGSRR